VRADLFIDAVPDDELPLETLGGRGELFDLVELLVIR